MTTTTLLPRGRRPVSAAMAAAGRNGRSFTRQGRGVAPGPCPAAGGMTAQPKEPGS